MTFTYNDPPVTPKDEVRFWSGDTVEQAWSVSDESVAYLLLQVDSDVMRAAAVVADRIGDWWEQSTAAGGAKGVGPYSLNRRDAREMVAGWRTRAARLRSGTLDGLPGVGGTLFTGSTDPVFTVGMMDNGVQRFPDRR